MVWATLMQNKLAAAPLITSTLHIDMEAMPDTSLVRVACTRQYSHIITGAQCHLLADHAGDLCIGRIAQPV